MEPRWIDAKVRLPESGGMYLIYGPSAKMESPLILTAWWGMPEQRWLNVVPYWQNAVTHWMPLPDPPKG